MPNKQTHDATLDDFVGKAAVITGAGSGIGAALAWEAARIGMRVVVSDIVADSAERVANGIVGSGGQAHPCQTDMRDAESVRDLSAFASEKFGAVRLLVNNAGRTVFGASWELTPEQWRDALSVNIASLPPPMRAALERAIAAAGSPP
jgi:3-oxoacyl-[acyl-carrier protein] reductase